MPAASASKTAVIIVNTGSPAAPTKEALAQYLLEFLGDRRVVELNPWIWQPILRGIIIPRRSEASAQRYKTVWTKDGSPLMAISAKTAAAMQKALGEAFCVSWAMCYGTHRVAEVIAKAAQAEPERIVILPMFAQYATQTTEAVYDAVDRAVKKNPIGSEILRIRSYHNHPLYIEALAAGVRRHWEQAGALGEKGKVLMSFHGIPQASSDRGDPYEAQCKQTAALLAQKLGLTDEQYEVAFQSKFGKAKWLEPSAVETAQRLGSLGLERLDVICPGFAADCLETLEEIASELKGLYKARGGRNFFYIPALNDQSEAVKLYEALVREALDKS